MDSYVSLAKSINASHEVINKDKEAQDEFSKLFKDNSISIGGVEAVSLLDTTPFAIMFIFCGVLIIIFIWVGYISKRLKNEA